jgi:uncharacterized protein (TIGR01440 family)
MDDQAFLAKIRRQVTEAVNGLLAEAPLTPGQVLVVGCSTSEVGGAHIGTAGSEAVAQAILEPLWDATQAHGLYLACQCCEHLNRALVVSAEAAEHYGWEQVMVIPMPKAGGSFAARAMHHIPNAVVIEQIQAHAGLDIGSTLIGMHLRRVAVPVRLSLDMVGQARLTAARTRPKLIGGERAVYRLA